MANRGLFIASLVLGFLVTALGTAIVALSAAGAASSRMEF